MRRFESFRPSFFHQRRMHVTSSALTDTAGTPTIAAVVVLAAGLGTRMKSGLPKVLHPVCGLPIVRHVLRATDAVRAPQTVIVLGHGHELVRPHLPDGCAVAIQDAQRGTGHALLSAASLLPDGPIMVLPGDTPLLTPEVLMALAEGHGRGGAEATVLTMRLNDPSGYGRVVRGPGAEVLRIVEHRDAGPTELAITEVNSGMYILPARRALDVLGRVDDSNAQGEIYLTDVVERMVTEGAAVAAVMAADPAAVLGVNTRAELAEAETMMNGRICREWMLAGVTIERPECTQIHAEVQLEPDVVVKPFCSLHGRTAIRRGTTLGPASTLVDTIVGRDCRVPHCYLEGATIEDGMEVSPFTVVRAGRCGWSGSI